MFQQIRDLQRAQSQQYRHSVPIPALTRTPEVRRVSSRADERGYGREHDQPAQELPAQHQPRQEAVPVIDSQPQGSVAMASSSAPATGKIWPNSQPQRSVAIEFAPTQQPPPVQRVAQRQDRQAPAKSAVNVALPTGFSTHFFIR